MNAQWERVVCEWVNCIQFEGIKYKKSFKDIDCDDLDQISKYLILKEGDEDFHMEDYDEEDNKWLKSFLCRKYKFLCRSSLPTPNSEDFMIVATTLILHSCLSLKDEFIVSKMTSLEEDVQIHLKSLFSCFMDCNLALVNYQHFLEVLSLICPDSKSDTNSFSSPVTFPSCISLSTPIEHSSVKELQKKYEEVNGLKQKIAFYENEKEDFICTIKDLKMTLSTQEKELNQKNKQITQLNRHVEQLTDVASKECDSDVSSYTNLREQKYLEQINHLNELLNFESVKIYSLEEQLQRAKEKIKNVQDEKLELKDRCEELEITKCGLELNIHDLGKTVEHLSKQNEELCSLVNQMKETTTLSLNSEDISFRSLNCTSSNNIGNFLLMDAETRVNELNDLCQQKDNKIEELVENLRINEALLLETQATVDELSSQIQLNQKAFQEVSKKLILADKCLEEHGNIIGPLQRKLEALNAEKYDHEKTIVELKQCQWEVNTLRKQLNVSQKETEVKDELLKRMDSICKLSLQEKGSELILLEKLDYFLENAPSFLDIASLQNNERKLREEIAMLKCQLSDKDKIIEEKEYLKNSAAIELNEKVSSLQNHINILEHDLTEAVSLKTSLNDEIAILNSQVQNLKKDIHSKDRVIQEKEDLKNIAAIELANKIHCLELQVGSLESNNVYIKQIESLEEELKKKGKLLSIESTKLANLQNKYKALKAQETDRMDMYKRMLKANCTQEMKNREEKYISEIKRLKEKVLMDEATEKKLSKQVQKLNLELSHTRQMYESYKKNENERYSQYKELVLRSRTPLKQDNSSEGKKRTPVVISKIKPSVAKKILTGADTEQFNEHHKQILLQQTMNDGDDFNRLSELQARNSMLPPHLQTCYPGETQFVSPSRFREADYKTWSKKDSMKSTRLRQRSYCHLNRPSDAFFIPLERRKSASHESLLLPKFKES